jgi:hypothetical protein
MNLRAVTLGRKQYAAAFVEVKVDSPVSLIGGAPSFCGIAEELYEDKLPSQGSPYSSAALRSGLDDRLRFEMLMTELSTQFAGVTSASIDEEIVNAQRRIAETLELDRSTLVQLRDNDVSC